MRRAVVLTVLLAGCTWSNSLYQAHSLSGEAGRAERGGRPAEADGLWGQAAVKAESALARSPNGKHAPEARWLLGRALARGRDCVRGAQYLEEAYADAPRAKWSEALQLELARCVEASDTVRAAELFGALRDSRDGATRREAREHAGRDLVATGQPAAALEMLQGLTSPEARLDRAIALAQLGRADSAFVVAKPLLDAGDASIDWGRFVAVLAADSSTAVDRLLGELAALPNQAPQALNDWRLTALRGTPPADTIAFRRRLEALQTGKPGAALVRGRVIAAERTAATFRSLPEVLALRDSLVRAPAPAGDLVATQRWSRLKFVLGRIADEGGEVKPGAAAGDLIFFSLAELSRDSLGAGRLATALFARIEAGWPGSPFVPKSLLARIALEPDSGEAIRARIALYPSSPYLAYLRGMDDARYRQLEDSLATFIRERAAKAVQATAEVIK